LTGERRAATVGGWVVDPARQRDDGAALTARIEAAGPPGLDLAVLDERERALAATMANVSVGHGRARAGRGDDLFDKHPLVVALEAEPFGPRTQAPPGVTGAELRELVERGLVVRADGLVFASAAVDEATRVVAALFADGRPFLRVTELRHALRCSRPVAVALLQLLDGHGVTIRRGDHRERGRRLPPGP
ncbi:MAG: SelB C-terminal domain-containing protein, partial [Acidimicrobiia bacterium]|nr:SelB C-terminal domain-containing protein [Acidimicrobiia bacterium]